MREGEYHQAADANKTTKRRRRKSLPGGRASGQRGRGKPRQIEGEGERAEWRKVVTFTVITP